MGTDSMGLLYEVMIFPKSVFSFLLQPFGNVNQRQLRAFSHLSCYRWNVRVLPDSGVEARSSRAMVLGGWDLSVRWGLQGGVFF